MGQVIYESNRKQTPRVRGPDPRPAGEAARRQRPLRPRREVDAEQKLYVPDRQGSGIPWPWDAVQDLGERVCALREENRQLRARLHQATGKNASCGGEERAGTLRPAGRRTIFREPEGTPWTPKPEAMT